VFVYVQSEDYNEFLAIAEDLNLRIMDIVAESGTGFAFPSQTAYLARDHGLNAELARAAEVEVQGWRADGALPFPGLDLRRVAALDGSLDFPPEGSVQGSRPTTPAKTDPAPKPTRSRRWGLGRAATTKR
jgi:MscS family membrane protein